MCCDCVIAMTKPDKEKFLKTKRELITEALGFPKGHTLIDQIETIIASNIDNAQISFRKPGKESFEIKKDGSIKNKNDMLPTVSVNGKLIMQGFTFDNIWEYLLKIYIIHKDTFIKILTLLYRLCYFYDHEKNKNNQWRYQPNEQINGLIDNLESLVLRSGFKDKFNQSDQPTLKQFLYFVDILSWNEDVKYQGCNSAPYFKNFSDSSAGRTNTILSIISAPILISKFIENIVNAAQHSSVIDVKLITSVIQKFSKSRGLCVLSEKELKVELTPYLI